MGKPFDGAVLQVHPSGPSDGYGGTVARAGGGETVIRKVLTSLRERGTKAATLHALDESANGLRFNDVDHFASRPVRFQGFEGRESQVINVGWSIHNTQENGPEDTAAKTKAALHQLFDDNGDPAVIHVHNHHSPVVKEIMRSILEVGRERGIGVVHQAHNIWAANEATTSTSPKQTPTPSLPSVRWRLTNSALARVFRRSRLWQWVQVQSSRPMATA